MIVVPYVGNVPGEVIAPLPRPLLVQLDRGDSTAYSRRMAAWWSTGDDLIIIEHDVVIHDRVLPAFWRCPKVWCVYPYHVAGSWVTGLGCVRFRGGLLDVLPSAVRDANTIDDDGLRAGDWRRMDVRIAKVLHTLGVHEHIHWPPVTHLHRYPQPPPQHRMVNTRRMP